MPPTVAELVAAIDRMVPLGAAAGWDPVGLQVGDPAARAATVAVAHEVTGEVVAACAEVDLLVAYHPLLFDRTRRFVAGNGPAGRAYRLARAGTALVVVHTAFDVARGGAADALAAALGLEAITAVGPLWRADEVKIVTFVPESWVDLVIEAMAAAGAGRIGKYEECAFTVAGTGQFRPGPDASPTVGTVGERNAEPEVRVEMIATVAARDAVVAALVEVHPYEEPAYDVVPVQANAGFVGRRGGIRPRPLGAFADDVARALGAGVWVAGDAEREITSVAVVPGSGRSLIGAVGDVDVLVTGDISHHAAREALDRGLAVIDAGHVPTERPGLRRLYARVREIAPEAIDLTGLDPHPWEERPWRS